MSFRPRSVAQRAPDALRFPPDALRLQPQRGPLALFRTGRSLNGVGGNQTAPSRDYLSVTTTLTSTRRSDAAVLRRIWRLHFWIGLFAAPVLIVLALSGLVILYSQPLDS